MGPYGGYIFLLVKETGSSAAFTALTFASRMQMTLHYDSLISSLRSA